MEPEALWRLYSRITFLATTLSNAAMVLEGFQEDVNGEAQDKDVRADAVATFGWQIRGVYDMIAEASKLVPLFDNYAEALASGPPVPLEAPDSSDPGALRVNLHARE